jgi:hypothetical protein
MDENEYPTRKHLKIPRMFVILACACLIVLSTPIVAMAQNTVNLGNSTSGGLDLIGVGSGTVEVVTNGLSGPAFYGTDQKGAYSLGGLSADFGPPNAAGNLPAQGTQTETFTFSDPAGNSLTGTITWGDLTTSATLQGTLLVATVAGSQAFKTIFPVNSKASASVTFGGLGRTILQLANGPAGLSSFGGDAMNGMIVGTGTSTCVPTPCTTCPPS